MFFSYLFLLYSYYWYSCIFFFDFDYWSLRTLWAFCLIGMNKAYFGSFLVIFHLSILLNSFSYWFTLIHFLILMFFIKLILTIKHLILISFLFINLFKGMSYYNDWLVNIRFNTLDWFMVFVRTACCFGIKIDAIPGRINLASTLRSLFKGEHRGFCFELCGQGHSSMLIVGLILFHCWSYYFCFFLFLLSSPSYFY